MEAPRTEFLEHDGVSIAWQVFGEGPAEILFIPGWISNVDMFWQYPGAARVLHRARDASPGWRSIDKPGTGASDPDEATPSVEERVDQLIAVMDAADLKRPTVIAFSEGGVTGCLAAAGRPSRVERLVLLNATATSFDPRGRGDMTDAEWEDLLAFVRRTAAHWGEGTDGERWLPGLPDADASWGRLQRACSTRAVARRYMSAMEDGLTAWDALPAIHQPVLVLHRSGDPVLRIKAARAAWARLPHATVVELPGNQHLPWLGDTAELLVRDPLVRRRADPRRSHRARARRRCSSPTSSAPPTSSPDSATPPGARSSSVTSRSCVTGSTASTAGSSRRTGDGALATFTGPARGAQAARAILDGLAAHDLHARAGLHVGEIELQGDDIAGLAVHVAARVMGHAGDDEVLVSRTVRDLTAGSGLRFEDRGTHTLKGIPEDWQLYALA